MATSSFQFRLITPQGKVLDAAVTSANVPAHDGMMGFLPGRAPIVSTLGCGALNVTLTAPLNKGDPTGPRTYYVEDGFLQMVGDKLTVLTTKAIPAEELVEGDIKAELAAAEAKSGGKPEEMPAVTKAKNSARAKLRVAQSVSGKGI